MGEAVGPNGLDREAKLTPSPGAWATHAALVLVQIAFASQAVESKVAMAPRAFGGEEIFPESLAMARMFGGALFFHAFAYARGMKAFAISRRDHVALLGLSIIGISANQTLYLLGLRWTTPFAASLLGATIPIFTAFFAVVFGRERLVGRTVAGLVCCLCGVLFLTGIGSIDRGAIFLALNSLSYAAYVVLSRDVILRVGAVRSVVWLFTYGALLFAPIGAPALISQVATFTPRGWMYIAYIVVMPTIVAYSFNAWALGRSSATLVAVYIYIQPLIAGTLAWVQLGQGISRRAAIAAVAIVAGLAMVASRQPAARTAHSRV